VGGRINGKVDRGKIIEMVGSYKTKVTPKTGPRVSKGRGKEKEQGIVLTGGAGGKVGGSVGWVRGKGRWNRAEQVLVLGG